MSTSLRDGPVVGLARGLGHGRDVGFPLVGGAGQAQAPRRGPARTTAPRRRRGPPVEGRDLVDELVLGDLGQAAQDALPLLRIGLGGQLDLVDADQLLPLLADAVERLENLGDLPLHGPARHHPLERGARLLVLWRDAEDLLVGLDGLGQIAERHFEDLRQAVGERNDLVLGVGQADLAADDVGQLLPALGHGVEPVERDQAVLAIGLGLGHALVGRDGLVDLAGLLLVDARQAQQHLDLQLAVHRRARSQPRWRRPARTSARWLRPCGRGAR